MSEPGGTPDEQRRAWREWRRAKDAEGIIAKWEEIPSARLVHSRHWIEDTETGNLYREFRRRPQPPLSRSAPTTFEPTAGRSARAARPPSREEIEKRRAARERRRLDQAAAAKARYDELRKGARR
jgi:hypothetical protein